MSKIHTLLNKIIPLKNRTAEKSDNSANKRKYGASGRRDAIMEALNKSTVIFAAHKEKTFDEVMTNGIRPLAEAAGIDRVSFYTMADRKGKKCFGQIYRWDKSQGGLTLFEDELLVLPNIPPVERIVSFLSKGDCVKIRESEYREDEKVFFGKYGIRSALYVPIFTHDELWGGVSFQDHTNGRSFDEDCFDLLYTAAYVFSNAIIRMLTERKAEDAIKALEQREKMASALNRAATKFLSHNEKTFEEIMTSGVQEIAGVFNLDRFSIWRNFYDSDGLNYGGQVYRWDKRSGGTTTPVKGMERIPLDKFVPNWKELLATGGVINSPVRLLSEAPLLQSFGAVSLLITPVFINNVFWGVAFFEDLHTERFFEEDGVDIMRSAAFLCANTVIHGDLERDITNAGEFTRAILDASPLGFTIFDENARVIDCNDSILKTLETSKEYYFDHFYEFSPERQSDGSKSGERAKEFIKSAVGGKKVVFDWMHRSLCGELIPFEVTLTHAKYNGKYVTLGYQYDLRNIKKMMENIREQSELLKIRLEQQELISEISRGFISSGESEILVEEAIAKLGRYHKVSLVFVIALDYQRKDAYLAYHWYADNSQSRMIIGNLFEFIRTYCPDNLPENGAIPIIFCDDTASSPDAVFQVLFSTGITAIIAVPLYVEGRLWGIISVEQASTPRKWTENEKEFVAITANNIAGVIMRDIYTIKLKDALYKATEASKTKSEFLSNMSHEMRTPLNAITGMTAIGKNAKDIERKDYALGKIKDASTHLLGVINDVLDMSKIEANMMELSPIEFNFEKMLQKTVAVVNFRVDEKRQKLTVHIDREIPQTLIADDQRLAQVVTNLLSNAVKFTSEEGSIVLDARCMGEQPRERPGFYSIQISVSDTGIGISGEQQKRLFSSFQQAESSTTRKYGGTGLGLAISKKIVEMMGGKIWVNSEQGKGSTFTFTILAERGTEKKHAPLIPDVNLNNVRILAVDDDPDILKYFHDITRRFGVHCDTALSGKEALDLINKNGPYHIYFVDWKMPVMDGIQLAHELKTHASKKSVAIMISAAEWSTIKDEAKKAGVDKFLSKPLFPSTIAEVINECIGVDKQQENDIQTNITGIFAGHRILLAEDVEINREIVQALFEPTQLEIDCAENGTEAVRMFTEAPDKYELIFMDLQMPEMDGYEATRRIRAIEDELNKNLSNDVGNNGGLLKQIPIIAMTANVFKEDIEKCLACGMNSHVGKPLDFEEVLNRLHSYLG